MLLLFFFMIRFGKISKKMNSSCFSSSLPLIVTLQHPGQQRRTAREKTGSLPRLRLLSRALGLLDTSSTSRQQRLCSHDLCCFQLQYHTNAIHSHNYGNTTFTCQRSYSLNHIVRCCVAHAYQPGGT